MTKERSNILIYMVCLAMLTACVQKERSQNTSVLHTSHYEIGNVMRVDSTEVLERVKTERRADLDSFLVDVDTFISRDTLLAANCDWYCLKTLNDIDAKLNCDIQIDLPSSNSWHVNTEIKRELFSQRDKFLEELNQLRIQKDPFVMDNSYRSEFRVRLLSAHRDSSITSFCFSVDAYTAAAPHEMPMLYSFNFDTRTNRRVTFDDVFDIETQEDSLLLIELIKTSFSQCNLHLPRVYEFDFNMSNDYLIFNFDAYEITGYVWGTPRIPLNKEAILRRFGKTG